MGRWDSKNVIEGGLFVIHNHISLSIFLKCLISFVRSLPLFLLSLLVWRANSFSANYNWISYTSAGNILDFIPVCLDTLSVGLFSLCLTYQPSLSEVLLAYTSLTCWHCFCHQQLLIKSSGVCYQVSRAQQIISVINFLRWRIWRLFVHILPLLFTQPKFS